MTFTVALILFCSLGVFGCFIFLIMRNKRIRTTWDVALPSPNNSTEFKTLEEMTELELEYERKQQWSILKSDTTWWICRNEVPYMHCRNGLTEANDTLKKYNLACIDVDTRQGPTTNQAWREFRRGKELTGQNN